MFSDNDPLDNDTLDQEPDVIEGILSRYRSGSMTDTRARRALCAYLTSLAPEGYLNDQDRDSLEVYLDISLQALKRPASSSDADGMVRLAVMRGIGEGTQIALQAIR